MKKPITQMHLLFLSSLLGMIIWVIGTNAHAKVQPPENTLPLAEYEARYKVSWHGIRAGESYHRLYKREDGTYHFETKTKPYLSFLPYHYLETTDFTWEDGNIVPQNYFYHIKEGNRLKKGNVLFDWQSNRLENKVSNEPWAMEMPTNIQDKLTHTLKLRQDLKEGKSDLVYVVAEDDEVKTYAFTVLGIEQVQTKIGNVETLKIEHLSRKGRRTLMWLAKDFDFVPIKVQHFRKNKKVGSGEIIFFKESA